MKKLTFTVEIEFMDKISQDNEIAEVAKNILNALVGECESGMGLSPEATETWTKSITVTEPYTKTQLTSDL